MRTRALQDFERELIRLVVERPGVLNEQDEALYRYAAVLARMHLLRTPTGEDCAVNEDVDDLRVWMLETLVELIPSADKADVHALRQLAPILSMRLETTRQALLERHVNDFGAQHLDDEIRHKKLVLSLGGGGGAGLMHLGVFSMFDELGHEPELIVGSSMGAIMGALRAINLDYDPVATALALPREISYNSIFRPFTGYSRFGFPGAFHMNLLRVAREIFHRLIGRSTLNFSDLPIKLQIVTSGIRTGFQLDEDDYMQKPGEGFTPLAMRHKLRLFFGAVRQLSKNPRFLTQVVFGKEHQTSRFSY